ncbi:MAG: family 10 glycosylhydrolase [Cyanobacteriota bacterium]|nr:family 10 glycosylhydrolase [Cyanobacteriota bacterium]
MAPRPSPALALLPGLLALLLTGPGHGQPSPPTFPPAPPTSDPGGGPVPNPKPAMEPIRAVWMTLNDMATLRDRGRMQTAVDQLAEIGVRTIYAVAWNGGYAYYPSRVTAERGLQHFTVVGLQGQPVLAELIEVADRHGLRVIPWFEFGLMAPPSSELALRHPQWLSQRRDGSTKSVSAAGEVVWLNPFRPEVQQLITELVLELVNLPGSAGVQFDDHMSLPSDFGYDPYTVALYTRESKRPPPADPQDPAWVKWRADRLTAFLVQLRQAVRATNPQAVVSVSPNYHDFAYKRQLQDWRAWVQRQVADEIVVQVYRDDPASFERELDRPELQPTAAAVPTAIGVMAGQRGRPVPLGRLEEQVRASRRRGLGVAFFYFETLWQLAPEAPEQRRSALRRLLAEPVPTP